MSIGMRMPLAAALALCACASSQRTLVLDLRPLHGAAGREVRVDPDEVRVYNRDRPILTLWARYPGSAAQVSLPPGPIAEAVKQHPELLGAVVAANLAPLAPDGRYRLVRR